MSPSPSKSGRNPRVLIIFGASRGIGACLAREGALNGDFGNIVLLGKTLLKAPGITGSLEEVLEEIKALQSQKTNHVAAHLLAFKCDVRLENEINKVVDEVFSQFGRIDAFIYNAGAILWKPVLDTPLQRFDLLHAVNARGFYIGCQAILPIMIKQPTGGRILVVSPPIYSRFFRSKIAYATTKVAMTVLSIGLAQELPSNISISTIWPATSIQSYVTDKMGIPLEILRKPEIFSDASYSILRGRREDVNGECFIDQDYLEKFEGLKFPEDFKKYRVVEGKEPPRSMPKVFPDLRVAEQDERGFIMASHGKANL